jgi:chromosome segregation ATPase
MNEKEKVKKKQKKPKSTSIADRIKRRLNWISAQQHRTEIRIVTLEKRRQRYAEGLPKVEAQLEKLKAKQKELAEKRERELKTVEELSQAFQKGTEKQEPIATEA